MEETSWLIPFAELSMESEVGRGAYGRVFRARHLHTTVAAKQVSKEKKSSNEGEEGCSGEALFFVSHDAPARV